MTCFGSYLQSQESGFQDSAGSSLGPSASVSGSPASTSATSTTTRSCALCCSTPQDPDLALEPDAEGQRGTPSFRFRSEGAGYVSVCDYCEMMLRHQTLHDGAQCPTTLLKEFQSSPSGHFRYMQKLACYLALKRNGATKVHSNTLQKTTAIVDSWTSVVEALTQRSHIKGGPNLQSDIPAADPDRIVVGLRNYATIAGNPLIHGDRMIQGLVNDQCQILVETHPQHGFP